MSFTNVNQVGRQITPVKTIADRIRELRGDKGQAAFAREVGVSAGTIGNLEAGTRAGSVDTLLKIAKARNVRIEWLQDGSKPKYVTGGNVSPGPDIRGTVPLLSSVQAGDYKAALAADVEGAQRVPSIVPVNRYTFALRVKGDSMAPKFMEGTLLIVEPEMDAQPGDYVIVRNGSEEISFKQLVRDGADWFLKPLNERYPIKPLGDNEVIGVVRGVTEQFR
jgi:SOS-response transcriptional repressor LexA